MNKRGNTISSTSNNLAKCNLNSLHICGSKSYPQLYSLQRNKNNMSIMNMCEKHISNTIGAQFLKFKMLLQYTKHTICWYRVSYKLFQYTQQPTSCYRVLHKLFQYTHTADLLILRVTQAVPIHTTADLLLPRLTLAIPNTHYDKLVSCCRRPQCILRQYSASLHFQETSKE